MMAEMKKILITEIMRVETKTLMFSLVVNHRIWFQRPMSNMAVKMLKHRLIEVPVITA